MFLFFQGRLWNKICFASWISWQEELQFAYCTTRMAEPIPHSKWTFIIYKYSIRSYCVYIPTQAKPITKIFLRQCWYCIIFRNILSWVLCSFVISGVSLPTCGHTFRHMWHCQAILSFIISPVLLISLFIWLILWLNSKKMTIEANVNIPKLIFNIIPYFYLSLKIILISSVCLFWWWNFKDWKW